MLMAHPAKNCATCVYWQRLGPQLANAKRDPGAGEGTGTCQARSPAVVNSEHFPVSMFPQTHESRFCGEWEGTLARPDDGGGSFPGLGEVPQ